MMPDDYKISNAGLQAMAIAIIFENFLRKDTEENLRDARHPSPWPEQAAAIV